MICRQLLKLTAFDVGRHEHDETPHLQIRYTDENISGVDTYVGIRNGYDVVEFSRVLVQTL